jgi:hypothetical protein
MDLTPHISAVEDSLAAAAAAGDEDTRRTAAALTAALEPAMRLAMMNALSDLALEVSEQLGDRAVELRLESGDIRVGISADLGRTTDALDEEDAGLDAGGEPIRITLRLPESLKTEAERAAAAQTISLNTWLVRAVRESLRGNRAAQPGRTSEGPGHRVRGWVQS